MNKAKTMIVEMAGIICKSSALYETDPWGFDDPMPFLNQVVEIETDLEPEVLLEKLLTIESRLGRIRPFDACGCGIPATVALNIGSGIEEAALYTGRTIDLDILFYGQRMVFTDNLMIPHPRLHERKFTLVPLNEISREFVHPLLKKSMERLLQDCTDQCMVKKVENV